MRHRLSIRLVLPLITVSIAVGAMSLVSAIYSTTATTMFNQLGMSGMLKDMQQVSQALSSTIATATTALNEAAEDVSDEDWQEKLQRVPILPDGLVSTVLLFDEFGRPLSGQPSTALKETCRLETHDWFKAALRAEIGETVFSRPHVQNLYEDQYPWVVSLTRRVRYRQDGEERVGVLMVDMRLYPLGEICRSVTLGSLGSPFIMAADSSIIFHPDQKLLSLELISEDTLLEEESPSGDKMVLSQDIVGTDWQLVGTVTADDITENSAAFKSRMAGMVVGMAVLVLLVAVWLSRQVTRPLTDMQAYMQSIQRNLDDVRMCLPEEGFAEYAALSHSYNEMLEKIRALMEETNRRQEELRKMEISALQEQINPHFLYNTLDSIVRVLETNRVPQAIEMVQALAKLFRLSINNGEYFLTVGQEMDYAENYLTIQKVRYRNKFSTRLIVDERIKDYLCPKIILQPLIENAIKHGMSDMPGCTLTVCARQEGYNIVFTVEDDGLGIPPEELHGLQEMLRNDSNTMVEKSRYGIGLRNVNRRIRLLYGAEYGLTIESEVEERTCVTVTFPKKQS